MNDNNEDNKFIKIMKDQRIKKGISQEKMALDLDIDQSWLSKVELGKRTIKDSEIHQKIKDYLN